MGVGEEKCISALETLLEDGNRDVRSAAADALKRLQN
jgi:HEAT repeat protein